MNIIYATYNRQHNSIDVYTYAGYFLRIDYNTVKDGLKATLYSECALTALAIDEPLEYARSILKEICDLSGCRRFFRIVV